MEVLWWCCEAEEALEAAVARRRGLDEIMEVRRRSGRRWWSFSSPPHVGGQSGCKTIILSPLSLYGSHRRWLTQVAFWWLRDGGE